VEPKPPISGCLDREIIRRVFRRQRDELTCCGQALAAGRGPVEVAVRFSIDGRGRVDGVTVKPRVAAVAAAPLRQLARCLVAVISSLKALLRPALMETTAASIRG
jgi:hypothetical protein